MRLMPPHGSSLSYKVIVLLDVVTPLLFPSPGEEISAKFSQHCEKLLFYFAEKKTWGLLKLLRLHPPTESFCCPTRQPAHTHCGGQKEIQPEARESLTPTLPAL